MIGTGARAAEAGEAGEATAGAEPLADLARIAACVAGVSACFRGLDGTVLGSAGLLDPAGYDLGVLGPAPRVVVVPDTTLERRVAAHPHVQGAPYVRFWARIPVLDRSGVVLAWLDLADGVSRLIPDDRLDVLTTVARQAACVLRSLGADPGWRTAIFQVPTPIYLLRMTPAGEARFLDGNEAARRITAPETSSRFGSTVDEIFPWAAANRVTERCAGVARTGEPASFQLPITVHTGARALFHVRIFPLPEDHLGVAVEDLSERADLQRRKEEFVTMVAHELRTPLASIRGAMGLLDGGVAGPLPEHATRLVGMAREGAERLSRMLTDMLDLERLRGGLLPLRSEPIGVAELLALATHASAGAARAAGVRVESRVEEDATVLGDRERLAQALTNLLSNAVKFSPSGGSVRLCVSRPEPTRVRVEVRDDGLAVAPADAERLFLPFQSSEAAGARGGLGLAISRFIVEGHGGAIGVRAEGDVGATFWFDLPVLANPR